MVKSAEQEMRKLRVRLLLDLANLRADSPRLLRLMESFEPNEQPVITSVQHGLQLIWQRDVPLDAKQRLVNYLLVGATQYAGDAGGLIALLKTGSLEFAGNNFVGQVLVGILENWPRMARCTNPECTVRYFFAKRSSQVYCERGECTRYAQRKKAKKYWEENRAAVRQRRKLAQKARKKRK
jgi:hypothetical protein